MSEVEEFIYQFEGQQRDIMLWFHKLLVEELGLEDKISYQIPFYYKKSWVCYLNPTKGGAIEFAFPRGNELANAQGLLDNKGRKQVYSIAFAKLGDIPEQPILELIHEAILLDETTPYEAKRKARK